MCFSDLCGPIENTSMSAEKHPFTCCPAAKYQNAAILALQTYGKNQWTFFIAIGSFAKVSIPVESIIPWLNLL